MKIIMLGTHIYLNKESNIPEDIQTKVAEELIPAIRKFYDDTMKKLSSYFGNTEFVGDKLLDKIINVEKIRDFFLDKIILEKSKEIIDSIINKYSEISLHHIEANDFTKDGWYNHNLYNDGSIDKEFLEEFTDRCIEDYNTNPNLSDLPPGYIDEFTNRIMVFGFNVFII